MKVLVTGASGFIGGNIANGLAQCGYDVVATGRRQRKALLPQINYAEGDLTHESFCQRIVNDCEMVVHCVGQPGAWGAKSLYTDSNVTTTEALLKASTSAGVRRFINISSPSVYFAFKDQFDLRENFVPQKFSSAYAETKYIAEQLVSAAHNESFETISLRPRSVIGEGDRVWLPRIVEMQQRGELVQPGTGENIVDFTSIENLLQAVKLALETEGRNCGKIYNITDGQPVKLWGLIDYALDKLGLSKERKKVPVKLAMLAALISESFHKLKQTREEPKLLRLKVGVMTYSMTLNIDSARENLGYQPEAMTYESVDRFSKWWKELQS